MQQQRRASHGALSEITLAAAIGGGPCSGEASKLRPIVGLKNRHGLYREHSTATATASRNFSQHPRPKRGARPPIDAALFSLNHLAERKYAQREVMYPKLPVFPVVSWLPGDFRAAEEINKTVAENKMLGSYHLNPDLARSSVSL